MKKDIKNIVVTICFLAALYGFMVANILLPDKTISFSERRTLLKIPSYSSKELIKGELLEDYEKYFLDQFVLRDELRGLKAYARLHMFHQKDNNYVYIIDGIINKMEYPLKEKAIENAAKKLNEVYEKYLQDKNVSFSIIPDKNFYVASEHGYLSMDYDKLVDIMKRDVKKMAYIDLFYSLEIEDYYKTDLHWSQDKIIDIADMVLKELGNEAYSSEVSYHKNSLYPFYGAYYGQAALKLPADSLVYLTNEMIENAIVYDHIDQTYSKVYLPNRFGTIDSYDLFLSGAKSLITITNPASNTNKELILFRDSFGSSIAPLLLKGYAKITLVDLRYMETDILGDYIDFSKEQDVLFLYNTLILNNSYMLK
ncbi:MAG: hypothetical protein K0S47_1314 [Herbinix sp.]|jgi:hypothetical protein|nr:hypothetical protein [Herbinix sp.]